jgi:hypothetical protein
MLRGAARLRELGLGEQPEPQFGDFARILTGLHGDRLDDWLAAVEADDQPDLHSFARGIRRSGVVEGNVNRVILWNAPSSQSTESVLRGNPRR